MIREKPQNGLNGIASLVFIPSAILGVLAWLIWAAVHRHVPQVVAASLFEVVLGIGLFGFFMLQPNQGVVLTLFGDYRGTARTAGLRWANPFYRAMHISLRVRNFETAQLKVNDNRGNPVEIGAIIVWKVVDTAEAAFQVDSYENYVHVQSEAALRNMATHYPYDAHGEEVALSSHTAEISEKLRGEVQERLAQAGVQVTETRISHLAYAPEIAAAMLRRQQATAVVAARQKIVEGAVGMVEHALDLLAEKKVIDLEEERKAAMVSNLLVVLCSDHAIQPIVNTGTLYP